MSLIIQDILNAQYKIMFIVLLCSIASDCGFSSAFVNASENCAVENLDVCKYYSNGG